MAEPVQPLPRRVRRNRPTIATSLSAVVADELRNRAKRAGIPVARLMDAALRVGLGLPPEVPLGPATP
jgi:hypothetical protein